MHDRPVSRLGSAGGAFGRCVLVLLLAWAGLLGAGPARAKDLVGQMLVARPEMPDPRFGETVILIVADDADGTVGLVINRPLGPLRVSDLLEAFSLPAVEGAERHEVQAIAGGPVEIGAAICLHSTDYRGDGTRTVADGIAVTAGGPLLEAEARGRGPKQLRLAFGYAGWGPGQLEREVSEGSWDVVPADPGLVFTDHPATVWEAARAKRGISL